MNRLLDFTGGKPDFNIDDMLWNDEATYNALNDVFRAFGDNYIIQGVTGTTPVTAGYVMLDGEILKVDAHAPSGTHFEKVTTYDTGGDVTFIDGTARQTWQINRATISAVAGNLEFLAINRMKRTKEVQIGDWDMDTTGSVTVAHGVSNHQTIRIKSIIIRKDGNTTTYPLYTYRTGGEVEGGVSEIDATNITLTRLGSGSFDSAFFDDTSYNRGWITFEYVE